MPQIIFDFKDLICHCLHEPEIKFTNAIGSEIDGRTFIAELFKNLQMVCQEAELKELFKREHFHFVQNPYIAGKIIRLVDKPYLDFDRLCQIPLGQQPRLYGNLKKLKHTNYYLFRALILDPNHLIYEESKFNKLKNLTCLFNQEKCREILIKKTMLKKHKKKEKN